MVVMILVIAMTGCKTSKKVTENTTPLRNIQWNLLSIGGEILDTTAYSKQPCIVFGDDGKFNGNFGCNSFYGDYYQKKQKLEIDYLGSTKMLCNQMAVERAMLKAIKAEIDRFEIIDDVLILYAGKDEVIRFVSAGAIQQK